MADQRQVAAYEYGLRIIASAAVRARRDAGAMGVLPRGAGEQLLVDVEHALASLIALGAVPSAPPPAVEAPVPHASNSFVPSTQTIDLMLNQLARDRRTAYWGVPPHSRSLDGAEAWLLSMRDWAAGNEGERRVR